MSYSLCESLTLSIAQVSLQLLSLVSLFPHILQVLSLQASRVSSANEKQTEEKAVSGELGSGCQESWVAGETHCFSKVIFQFSSEINHVSMTQTYIS